MPEPYEKSLEVPENLAKTGVGPLHSRPKSRHLAVNGQIFGGVYGNRSTGLGRPSKLCLLPTTRPQLEFHLVRNLLI